jgi:hypothetical protein
MTEERVFPPINSSAPCGPFKPLPPDWRDKALAVRVAGPANTFVAVLQRLIERHGEKSILIPEVQALAMVACGTGRVTLDHWIQTADALTRVAGSDWPVRVCLDERSFDNLSIWDTCKELDAIDAKWQALRYVIGLGWKPVEMLRGETDPDWKVQPIADGRLVELDAKFKRGRGATGMLLSWILHGAALIERGAVLREYDWSWDVADACRDEYGRQFADALWDVLPTIARTIRAAARRVQELSPRRQRRKRHSHAGARRTQPCHLHASTSRAGDDRSCCDAKALTKRCVRSR